MRQLSNELQQQLQSGVTSLCYVWRLTLKDGRIFSFTDHDEVVKFQNLVCAPGSGLLPGETETRLGLAAQAGSAMGVLNDNLINANDIRSGHYDQAKIELFRVNWKNPSLFVHLSSGSLGDIHWTGSRFEAEWRGPAHKLSRSMGRVFTRYCDAEFGDARCGLNIVDYPEAVKCPHTFSACRDQFSNSVNFRGHPFLIGNDALTATPREGDIRDGGSRYKI